MTHCTVIRIAACGVLVAVGTQRCPAQQATPGAPTTRAGSSQLGGSTSPVGPYVSSTLPSTGHPTRFKRYAGGTSGQQFGQQLGQLAGVAGVTGRGGVGGVARRSPISPYLNLVRGGDPALNYFLGVQPLQQLNAIGTQTTETNTQLGGLRRDVQAAPQQPITFRPLATGQETPLKRQVVKQEQLAEPTIDRGDARVLQEILKELKKIREHVAPDEDKKQD